MNLKTPLTINIFWNTPEALKLQDLGIESESHAPELKEMTFYTIDSISEYNDDVINKPCTTITSGGMEYVADGEYKVLKRLIYEIMNLEV